MPLPEFYVPVHVAILSIVREFVCCQPKQDISQVRLLETRFLPGVILPKWGMTSPRNEEMAERRIGPRARDAGQISGTIDAARPEQRTSQPGRTAYFRRGSSLAGLRKMRWPATKGFEENLDVPGSPASALGRNFGHASHALMWLLVSSFCLLMVAQLALPTTSSALAFPHCTTSRFVHYPSEEIPDGTVDPLASGSLQFARTRLPGVLQVLPTVVARGRVVHAGFLPRLATLFRRRIPPSPSDDHH